MMQKSLFAFAIMFSIFNIVVAAEAEVTFPLPVVTKVGDAFEIVDGEMHEWQPERYFRHSDEYGRQMYVALDDTWAVRTIKSRGRGPILHRVMQPGFYHEGSPDSGTDDIRVYWSKADSCPVVLLQKIRHTDGFEETAENHFLDMPTYKVIPGRVPTLYQAEHTGFMIKRANIDFDHGWEQVPLRRIRGAIRADITF